MINHVPMFGIGGLTMRASQVPPLTPLWMKFCHMGCASILGQVHPVTMRALILFLGLVGQQMEFEGAPAAQDLFALTTLQATVMSVTKPMPVKGFVTYNVQLCANCAHVEALLVVFGWFRGHLPPLQMYRLTCLGTWRLRTALFRGTLSAGNIVVLIIIIA